MRRDEKEWRAKNKENKLTELIYRFDAADQKRRHYEEKAAEMKDLIIRAMKDMKITNFNCEYVPEGDSFTKETKKTYSISLVTKNTFNYDISEIKKRIRKSLFNKMVVRTAKITDYTEFIEIMKEYGVPFSEVKPYLSVEEKVDMKEMQRLYELEKLKPESISGCYTISKSQYIRVK